MKTIHWLYVITILLFVTSVGLVIVSARAAQRSAAFVTPIASTKEIMNGMVEPASTAVFNAVSTSITAKGAEEIAPKNDQEWQAVTDKAAMLVESANLLMIGSRIRDKGEWIRQSQAFMDASRVALDAARARRADALFAAGEAIDKSCDRCHEKYQK